MKIMSEIRFAVRRLRRAPSFAAVVVLVLALGIGGTTAVFSLVHGILLEPLPYPDSGRLVRISNSVAEAGGLAADQSEALVMLYQDRALAFEGVAAWRFDDGVLRAVEEGQSAARVRGARVTANFFYVLGVPPMIGRGFVAGEDHPGTNGVAVLSHRVWQERFRGDPDVIGRQIIVNDVRRTIVGIMPPHFAYPSSQVELWLPLALDAARPRPEVFNLVGIGRLKRGVTAEAAQADLARVLGAATWQQSPITPGIESLRDSIIQRPARLLWLLLGSSLLVLLAACTNVAGLFLIRAQRAQTELAVRGALGAGLSGLVALTVSEALLLSALGGGIGVWLANVSMKVLMNAGAALSLPRLENVGVDTSVMGFAFGVTVICAIFVSVLPLIRSRRISVAQVLRGAGSGRTSGRSIQRARDGLVVAQIAVALLLVASSGLMVRSFIRLTDVQPGFDADQVVTSSVLLPFARYGTATSRLGFFDELVRRTQVVPGVHEVALTDRVPLSGDHQDMAIEVEDLLSQENGGSVNSSVAHVDGRYFPALRIPILRGRTFTTLEDRASDEVIVSRAFAERYWPGADPLGKRVRPVGGPWYTVVGEVGDVHYDGLAEPANAIAYFPIVLPGALSLMVRTSTTEGEVLSAIREIVRALDEDVPTYNEGSLRALVVNASARTRALVVLLAMASIVTSLLGAIGLYGSIAYGVGLRRRELGIRLALGAPRSQVRRMVSFGGLRLAAVGIGIGTACTLATSWLLRALLYGVSPIDPATLAVTAGVLFAMAFVASWIPARRAAAIDPAEAFRSD
jgi:putative ABC transport system permease protein